MSAITNAPILAGGNINTASIIKLSAVADFTALQAAVSTDVPIGIATEAQHDAPIAGAVTTAAASGQLFNYFGPGQMCKLQLGAVACAAGDLLTSDANGYGTTISPVTSSSSSTATGGPQWIAAQAYSSGNPGEKVDVRVMCVPIGF